MLNGWLVAALVALVCLLGATAYAEVRTELPDAGCAFVNKAARGPGANCETPARRDLTAWRRDAGRLPLEGQS